MKSIDRAETWSDMGGRAGGPADSRAGRLAGGRAAGGRQSVARMRMRMRARVWGGRLATKKTMLPWRCVVLFVNHAVHAMNK